MELIQHNDIGKSNKEEKQDVFKVYYGIIRIEIQDIMEKNFDNVINVVEIA